MPPRNQETPEVVNVPPTTPDPATDPMAMLAATIAAAVEKGSLAAVNAAKPMRLSIDQAIEDPANPSNPKRAQRLTRRYTQNRWQISATVLTDKEIELLEQLKPGKFGNGLITVMQTEHPGEEVPLHVDISYANRTPDQRIVVRNFARDFEQMLQKCIDEAAGQAATQAIAR